MKKYFLIFLSLIFTNSAFADEQSLLSFLQTVWRNHPLLKIDQLQRQSSAELEKSVHGRWLPHLSLEAIDSQGFPGSNSLLHEGGIVGSPFRSGVAEGIVAEQVIYDFGRTTALLGKVEADAQVEEAKNLQDKMEFLSKMADLYLNCAEVKSEIEENSELQHWIQIIADETKKMMHTGQRTVVDQSLTEIELTENEMNIQDAKSDLSALNSQLGLYMNKKDMSCQPLAVDMINGSWQEMKVPIPHLLLAKALAKASQASVEAIKANQRPRIDFVGSYGSMEQARLVSENNYNLGVGLVFPFFNGGEDRHREKAEDLRSQTYFELEKEIELDFKSYQIGLDAQMRRHTLLLETLKKDQELIEKTIGTAAKRYLTLNGTLVDLRESLKKLKDVQNKRIAVLHSLLKDQFLKNLIDFDSNN